MCIISGPPPPWDYKLVNRVLVSDIVFLWAFTSYTQVQFSEAGPLVTDDTQARRAGQNKASGAARLGQHHASRLTRREIRSPFDTSTSPQLATVTDPARLCSSTRTYCSTMTNIRQTYRRTGHHRPISLMIPPPKFKFIGILFALNSILTHWGRDRMAAVSQTTLSNAFSWMKISEFD